MNTMYQRTIDFATSVQAAVDLLDNATNVHAGTNYFSVVFDPLTQSVRLASNMRALNLGMLF